MGNAGAVAEAGVKNIVDNRMSEKKNMQVNDKYFSSNYWICLLYKGHNFILKYKN